MSSSVFYSLTSAANLLQVKRTQLLTIEQFLPELQTCLLRPSAEHYTAEEFALARAVVRSMHVQNIDLEKAISQYMLEKHGFNINLDKDDSDYQKENIDTSRQQTARRGAQSDIPIIADSESMRHRLQVPLDIAKIVEKTSNLADTETSSILKKKKRTRRKATALSTDREATEEPADWYYNKLYSEAQGQKSFHFDNPRTAYGSAEQPQSSSEISHLDRVSNNKKTVQVGENNNPIHAFQEALDNINTQHHAEEDGQAAPRDDDSASQQEQDKAPYKKVDAERPPRQAVKDIRGTPPDLEGKTLVDKLDILEDLVSNNKIHFSPESDDDLSAILHCEKDNANGA